MLFLTISDNWYFFGWGMLGKKNQSWKIPYSASFSFNVPAKLLWFSEVGTLYLHILVYLIKYLNQNRWDHFIQKFQDAQNVLPLMCSPWPALKDHWEAAIGPEHSIQVAMCEVCPRNSSIQKLHWLSQGFQVHSEVLIIIHKLLHDTRLVCLWDHLWLYCLLPHTVPSWSWYFMGYFNLI